MADNKHAEVLRTAESLINGDRADTYGSPTESFGRIGRMWGAILNMPDIDPSTVALMMAAMKISRASGQLDHEDSYVDLAGYAALGAEMGIPQGDRAEFSETVNRLVKDLDELPPKLDNPWGESELGPSCIVCGTRTIRQANGAISHAWRYDVARFDEHSAEVN